MKRLLIIGTLTLISGTIAILADRTIRDLQERENYYA